MTNKRIFVIFFKSMRNLVKVEVVPNGTTGHR